MHFPHQRVAERGTALRFFFGLSLRLLLGEAAGSLFGPEASFVLGLEASFFFGLEASFFFGLEASFFRGANAGFFLRAKSSLLLRLEASFFLCLQPSFLFGASASFLLTLAACLLFGLLPSFLFRAKSGFFLGLETGLFLRSETGFFLRSETGFFLGSETGFFLGSETGFFLGSETGFFLGSETGFFLGSETSFFLSLEASLLFGGLAASLLLGLDASFFLGLEASFFFGLESGLFLGLETGQLLRPFGELFLGRPCRGRFDLEVRQRIGGLDGAPLLTTGGPLLERSGGIPRGRWKRNLFGCVGRCLLPFGHLPFGEGALASTTPPTGLRGWRGVVDLRFVDGRSAQVERVIDSVIDSGIDRHLVRRGCRLVDRGCRRRRLEHTPVRDVRLGIEVFRRLVRLQSTLARPQTSEEGVTLGFLSRPRGVVGRVHHWFGWGGGLEREWCRPGGGRRGCFRWRGGSRYVLWCRLGRLPRAVHELGYLEPWDLEEGRATQLARRPRSREQTTPSTCDLATLVGSRLNDDSGRRALVLSHR
jgi:hypothetical protein